MSIPPLKNPTGKKSFSNKPVIGWRERVYLPDLWLGPIIAKIDTGARSAALHAENITLSEGFVSFIVPLLQKRHHFKLPLKDQRRVKSTSGHSELRAVIETMVKVGSYQFKTEITLTDRKDMGVLMLLGRNSVREVFLVHPGRSFLLSRQKRKSI